ncbi:Hypp8945 [Branchiostoma lanceolatum]|uniref:Hypp8945 protein n=1 Tax=Branchiostoma lanceolatum TaxID=7740 RepID=A0A8J9ZC16_BRALA|nr:Hypp8945 [Branchiostoma lanceolatum]
MFKRRPPEVDPPTSGPARARETRYEFMRELQWKGLLILPRYCIMQFKEGAAAVSDATAPAPGESPGTPTIRATCPYCGHVMGIPVVYSGHEQTGGHKTEKGRPMREETGQP